MKICIIVDDYLPNSTKVAAKMMHELAIAFIAQGHDVTVVTPDSNLYRGFSLIEMDGVSIYRFPSGRIKNVSKIKRAVNESLLSFWAWFFLSRVFRKNRNDLIVYYSPSIFWGFLVGKLRKLWNAPSFLILRDLFPQWAIDSRVLREQSFVTKYFRWVERINYNVADRIGIQSPKNVDWFVDKFKKKYDVSLLYNWSSDQPIVSMNKPYREKMGINDKVVFFYGGNIGHAQEMSNLLRLAENLRDISKIHFVLVGSGDEVELVKKTVERRSLKNLTLMGSVSQTEYRQLLSEFDVGLISLHRDHKTHNFPGKLLGYMVQSMPILGCVNPGNDLKEIIEDASAGFISFSGDDESLKLNAIRLLDEKLRQDLGKNSKRLLDEKFSVSSAVSNILHLKN
ncbi:glycosyltransferase family 4 protein [Leptospira adleri]|uniref:glycosyltransferase family 4 protein n=1 Tax=Leptospira adleri TaxID=2023186 RepID=UPI0010839471|nr:glycosyltransferase family 4 protein [Leptospira adleri]TGM56526.1 glycosyltransferase WbuB [Leptospira adleri]